MRISAQPLLGTELAKLIKENFEASFKGFDIELSEQLTDNPSTEVVWDDKEMRYTLGSALTSMRMGLSALLAEPYMAAANNLPAPGLSSHPGANQVLHWELQNLDYALAAQEQRKKFKSDILPRCWLTSWIL
jgi:type VI secretion system protein ImpL